MARAAGVAPMTVSRTINAHPYVTEKTAKRVRAAIRRLDYRPNHAARMLTGQLSRSIGLIVPDIADTFFSVIIHAAQEAARLSGYLVWLASSDDDPSIESAQLKMMIHHPVDGILLVPADSRSPHLKALIAGNTPIVAIDRPVETAATDSIGVENARGAHIAVDHLIGHGYKKILCVAVNSHLSPIKERIAGYKEAMRHAKLPCPKELRPSDAAATRIALADLFASRDRPQALFTTNNAATIWVIEALRELKIEMAQDIALVGFDDVPFFSLITPPVTAVSQPAADLGSISARLLLQRINGEFTASGMKTTLPVTLTIRESCGCKKEKK
ncbi:MAG TPA: LacI family DNA-binding transcriptional regulator [Terracidiphilus sp.]|nr:LacI family DNA-binding transcriptional regulator [Terracidiphilus sp.]